MGMSIIKISRVWTKNKSSWRLSDSVFSGLYVSDVMMVSDFVFSGLYVSGVMMVSDSVFTGLYLCLML